MQRKQTRAGVPRRIKEPVKERQNMWLIPGELEGETRRKERKKVEGKEKNAQKQEKL